MHNILHCNFCDKSQEKVSKMIKSDDSIICDECVLICVEILIKPEKKAMPVNPYSAFKGEGLTKREYAAIHILAGITLVMADGYSSQSELNAEVTNRIEIAVKRADALFIELGKTDG